MYAVIQSGGKQYRVSVGDRLRVESLAVKEGDTVDLDKVLAVSDSGELKVGTPLLGDTKVKATVLSHGRGDKIRVFKMKRRKNYRRQYGHRQNYTELEIIAIGDLKAPAKKAAESKQLPETDEKAGGEVKKAAPTKKKVAKKTTSKKNTKKETAASTKKVTKKAGTKKKTAKKASASKSDK